MTKYQQITDTIIEALEQDIVPWTKDWSGHAWNKPVNPITKKPYNGINVLLLMISANSNQFRSNKWASFKQISGAGGHVKKGSKSTLITFYRPLTIDKDTDDEKTIPLLKTYRVFNFDQTEGLEHLTEEKTYETMPVEQLDKYVSNIGACIETTGFQPCYKPVNDKIEMPDIKYFKSQSGYYATLLHELGHWTGNKTRLNRPKESRIKADYAFEELVAELTAAFLCSDLGIEYAIEKHTSYIKSWLSVLRKDCKAIFRASSLASKASEYLNNKQDNKQIANLA